MEDHSWTDSHGKRERERKRRKKERERGREREREEEGEGPGMGIEPPCAPRWWGFIRDRTSLEGLEIKMNGTSFI